MRPLAYLTMVNNGMLAYAIEGHRPGWGSTAAVSLGPQAAAATLVRGTVQRGWQSVTADRSSAPAPAAEMPLEALAVTVRGRVIGPSDPDYDEARAVWNARYDRRPAAILRCADAMDAVAGIRFARAQGWPLAVRGGSHSVAGHGTCDGGLVLDLDDIDAIDIDATGRRVSVGGGAHWAEVDAATARFGMATPGGQISTTGVGGLTLGGGVGWLMREHGLVVDNLISAEVVTADGQIRQVDAEHEPDLWWAIRGGGGNFGVATRFEYRLHPLETVLGGILLYPLSATRDALRFYREYVKDLSDQVTAMLLVLPGPDLPHVPPELRGVSVVGLSICHSGDPESAEREADRLRSFGKPAVDTLRRMPYPEFQGLFDRGSRAGQRNAWRSPFVDDLSDATIETIASIAETCPSPISQVLITQMEGAVARVADDATAFIFRRAPYYVEVISKWDDPADDAKQIAWADRAAEALEPASSGGTYVNFLDHVPASEVRASYGRNLPRLAAIKRRYDPDNVFRINHNIDPAWAGE